MSTRLRRSRSTQMGATFGSGYLLIALSLLSIGVPAFGWGVLIQPLDGGFFFGSHKVKDEPHVFLRWRSGLVMKDVIFAYHTQMKVLSTTPSQDAWLIRQNGKNSARHNVLIKWL